MREKAILLWAFIIVLCISCVGCGETVRGVSRDAHRVGKGVRTIFVAEE